MNYADLLESIAPELLYLVELINNPEIDPDMRRRNQEILLQEVGQAVYDKIYQMNAWDMDIEHTQGELNDTRYLGMAKKASDGVTTGGAFTGALIVSFLQGIIGKAQADAFQNAAESGKMPTVTRRIVAETCAWCRSLEGVHYDPDPDVFARHTDCDCQIITSGYKSRNGLLKNYKKTSSAVL